MQESHPPVSSIVTTQDDIRHVPLHDDIAQCARDLWVAYERPANRDLEIWLEAEQRLFAATTTTQNPRHKSAGVAASRKQRKKTESLTIDSTKALERTSVKD